MESCLQGLQDRSCFAPGPCGTKLGQCHRDHPRELAPADPSDLLLLSIPAQFPSGPALPAVAAHGCCRCGRGDSRTPVSRAGCLDLLLPWKVLAGCRSLLKCQDHRNCLVKAEGRNGVNHTALLSSELQGCTGCPQQHLGWLCSDTPQTGSPGE